MSRPLRRQTNMQMKPRRLSLLTVGASLFGALAGQPAGAQQGTARDVWQCTAKPPGSEQRRLEFDQGSGGASMAFEQVRLTGRFAVQDRHLVAVFDSANAGGVEQVLTLGLVSGRVVIRRRAADGSRPTVFAGQCQRVGQGT